LVRIVCGRLENASERKSLAPDCKYLARGSAWFCSLRTCASAILMACQAAGPPHARRSRVGRRTGRNPAPRQGRAWFGESANDAELGSVATRSADAARGVLWNSGVGGRKAVVTFPPGRSPGHRDSDARREVQG
jgi:hypothetical protein